MAEKTRILLVEDDPNLSIVLQDYLEMLGYEIILCKDGVEGLRSFHQKQIGLCIFDVMMPRKDGFTLAEEIRQTDQTTPIIFLTAKSLKEDRINGFLIGCDDYITKPFSTEELSLRIKAILKRCRSQQKPIDAEEQIYQLGKFTFDYRNLTLTSAESQQKLTPKEAALLKLLFINKNKLLTREQALKNIWGENDYFIGRSMDVFVSRIRKYLKKDGNISIINVHGSGFKLEIREGK